MLVLNPAHLEIGRAVEGATRERRFEPFTRPIALYRNKIPFASLRVYATVFWTLSSRIPPLAPEKGEIQGSPWVMRETIYHFMVNCPEGVDLI